MKLVLGIVAITWITSMLVAMRDTTIVGDIAMVIMVTCAIGWLPLVALATP